MVSEAMQTFQERVRKEYAELLSATADLTGIAARLLPTPPDDSLQQTIRYFAASMTNSNIGLALLCMNGHGADAVKLARGMFESQIALKYLIQNPAELRDFLEFDAVARWRRLQFYKSQHPALYASFPEAKKSEVDREFVRVQRRFVGKGGKMRDRWCRYPIAEMAKRVGLAEMYELFYRYASALHHLDPMGLGMLIDGESLDVQPAPSMAHIGIALGIGNLILLDALRDYSKVRQIDNENAFKQVEQRLAKAKFACENAVVGALQHVIGYE